MADTPRQRTRDHNSGLTRREDGTTETARDRQQDADETRRNEQAAREQTNRDRAQRERDGGQDAAIGALDEFVIRPKEDGPTPAAAAASPLQRLRIHVPQVKTTISLG